MTEKELLAMLVAAQVLQLATSERLEDLRQGKGIMSRDHERDVTARLQALAQRLLASG